MKRRGFLYAAAFCTAIMIISVCMFLGSVINAADLPLESPCALLFNKDGIWKDTMGNEKILSVTSKIASVKVSTTFGMWHYSGGHWKVPGDGVIYDYQIDDYYSNFNDFMKNFKAIFDVPLPAAVKDAIDSGRTVYVSVSAGENSYGKKLDTDRLFHTDPNQSQAEIVIYSDIITISLPIKFNFKRQDSNDPSSQITTLEEASDKIAERSGNGNSVQQNGRGLPIPDFGYGELSGAIWSRSGADLGGHTIIYYDGENYMFNSPYDIPTLENWWLGHLRMKGSDAVLDPQFDDEIVHKRETTSAFYHSRDVSVGHGTFKGNGAVGAMFYFPLEIDFYYQDNGDLTAIVKESVSSANEGGDVRLKFAVNSTFLSNVDTDYTITREWEGAEPVVTTGTLRAVSGENYLEPEFYDFVMPDKTVTVTFTVNPSNNPLESITDNNTCKVITTAITPAPPITGEIVLDYNVLTQNVEFSLGTITASLSEPGYDEVEWLGPATGSITVTNIYPNVFTDFSVVSDGATYSGNNIVINVSIDGLSVTLNPVMNATIKRAFDPFKDDPLGGIYGDNEVQDTISPPKEGKVTVVMSAQFQRSYRGRDWIENWIIDSDGNLQDAGDWGEWNEGTNFSDFSGMNDIEKTVAIKVYNGIESQYLNPKPLPHQPENNLKITQTSFKQELWWISKPIDLEVVRPMGDVKSSLSGSSVFTERTPPPVNGQYKRQFTNQNDAAVTWKTEKKMEDLYYKSREKARGRNYNIDRGEDRAVFASDLKYKNEYSYYPIRSGYYFNPAGTYSFTITTNVYRDTQDSTPEHAALVEAITSAFRYESTMVYINSAKQPVTIGGAPVSKTGTAYAPVLDRTLNYASVDNHPLFDIEIDKDSQTPVIEELRHDYTRTGTDSRFRRILEGYDESGTENTSYNAKKYTEYVKDGQHVYKITETTTVTITVNPDNTQVYTHAQMKNGDYYVRAYIGNIQLNSIGALSYNSEIQSLTLNGLGANGEFNNIKIKVVGSMYDDVR